MPAEHVSLDEFMKRYCETQDQTPEGLLPILQKQKAEYSPTGWFIARCEMWDSRRFGARVIVRYGPGHTFQEVPEQPFSPQGRASDFSAAECYILSTDLL